MIECVSGWMEFKHTGKCYKYIPNKITWTDAFKACQSISINPSSTLVSIHDNETNNFLTNLTGGKEWTWTGGYQDDNEKWFWTDGSKWRGYDNWSPGQPDDHGREEDHLGLNFVKPGHWNDFNNQRHPQGALCQYDPKTTSPSAIISEY